MKRHLVHMVIAFLLVLVYAGICAAERPDPPGPPKKEQMEKIRQRVETLRMWKLTEALALDEKTSAQLFPILNKYDRQRVELEKELRGGMTDLRESLRTGREGALKGTLDRLEANHKSMQRLKDEEWTELKKVLGVQQLAKYLIFQQEFERDLRKIIEEAREKRPEGAVRERPERPFRPERADR